MAYKQSLLMAGGTIVNALLGLGYYVLVARFLGVEYFGMFSYLLSLGALATDISDLGFSSALVRFGSAEKFDVIFTVAFIFRIAASALLGLFFWIGSIYGDSLLLYCGLMAVMWLFTSLFTQSLIARQMFGQYAASNIFGNIVRLGALLIIIYANLVSVASVLQGYALGGVITIMFGYLFIRPKLVGLAECKKIMAEVFAYNKSVTLSYGLASLSSRIDIPIIYYFAGPMVVGVYSSAQKLVSIIPQLAGAIDGVFAPKYALKKASVTNEYLKISILISFGLVFGAALSSILIRIFGQQYIGAESTLALLLLAYIPFILSGPYAGAILYKFGKSKYHLYGSAINLVISVLGFWLLVPALRSEGAALTIGASNLVIFLFYYFVFRKLDEKNI